MSLGRSRLPAVLVLNLLVGLAGPARGAEAPLVLRVSPTGAAPAGNGAAHRFADLPQALARVAGLRRQGEARAIVIELEPGIHRVAEPVRIGPGHAGTAAAPLILRGAPDGSSRLTGSVPLAPTTLPPRLREKLPEAARRSVRAYRLPEALRRDRSFREKRLLHDAAPRVTEIFDAGGALRPAQWPNAGWAEVAAAEAGSPRFTIKDGPPRLPDPSTDKDLWAEGYWRWDWLLETIPVAGLSAKDRRLTLADTPYEGIRPGARVRLVHALSALDEPGEWWRDRDSGLLLAWPKAGADALEAGLAETLILAEGARHLRIEHLRLDHARGDLIVVRGGEDVEIRTSELSWAAGRAAAFEDVTGGGVSGSLVHDIGAAAIRLVGGDRASFRSGNLFVRDSRFTRFARLTHTQSAAVELDGVGAEVSGNLIADAIGYAVLLRGNDHVFRRNEVARLIHGLSDTGAIYAGRDLTARGSIIEENYIHDIRPAPGLEVKGVYLDDMASGLTIRRNLFVDVQRPVFIGGGSDNVVTRNVFVSSNPMVTLDSRGLTWMKPSLTEADSEFRAAFAAVPLASPPWRMRYPKLAEALTDEPGVARDNQIVDNVAIDGDLLELYEKADPKRQILLFNTRLDGPAPKPGDLDALARFAAARRVPLGLDPAAMRRDGLPASPFPDARRRRARMESRSTEERPQGVEIADDGRLPGEMRQGPFRGGPQFPATAGIVEQPQARRDPFLHLHRPHLAAAMGGEVRPM
ncbi:right-handed parallel beta-helix repeat-containing protein, partial [Methylorubrum zatmanii]|uniref:right-handed parallel beta-helix repeat-containing protein n=1 Tax=Methylorubrum zatmanii TaxID=29429 RepID=UPI0031B619BC